MSLKQVEQAVLYHNDFEPMEPQYPVEVNALNIICDRYAFSEATLEDMAARLPGFVGVLSPGEFSTGDDYPWFAVLWFKVEETADEFYGSLYVAFPWAQDFGRSDGLALDRSIAVYTWGEVLEDQVVKMLGDLRKRMSGRW